MDDLPKYLTSPGHAISERQHWENLLKQEMLAMLLSEEPLTAAALIDPRRWARMAKNLTRIPKEMVERVVGLIPFIGDEETPQQAVDRMAPTLATASYNFHVIHKLYEAGIPNKRWITRHDDRVRESHREAEGQKRPLGQAFNIGGFAMQFPADSSTAPIEHWINDRCVVVGVMG